MQLQNFCIFYQSLEIFFSTIEKAEKARFYEFSQNELFGILSEPSRAFWPKARAKNEPNRAEPRLGYNTVNHPLIQFFDND